MISYLMHLLPDKTTGLRPSTNRLQLFNHFHHEFRTQITERAKRRIVLIEEM